MGKITGSPLNFTSNTESTNSKTVGGYGIIDGNSKNLQSIFGKHKFTPFPSEINNKGEAIRNNYQNIDFQNISITDLVIWSSGGSNGTLGPGTPYQLTYADFAYLKNVGVYPNNRLIVARRFQTPVGNDLTALTKNKTVRPLATLISWVPPDQDFLSLSFGEVWEDAAGSFETILNNIGKDLTLSSDNAGGMANLGGIASKAMNAIPLPGLTEGLQRNIAINLKLADKSTGPLLPVGDPNLIKKAKKRRTVDKGDTGSGLDAKISIKMVVEYEQKYIDGIDPTVVYMDLIANVLSFGTSNARFMWNQNFASGTKSLVNDLISGDLNALHEAIKGIIQAVITTVSKLVNDIKNSLITIAKAAEKSITKGGDKNNNGTDSKKADEAKQALSAQSTIEAAFRNSIGAIIGKYKVAIYGVINALTGSPSGYFHVQVGNPKRPVFSSGDMIVEEVTLTLGPVLSWNDLPSSIKAEFTLTNARPLGADELYAKFNNSMARAYVRNKDFNQKNAASMQQEVDKDGNPTGRMIETDPDSDVEDAVNKTQQQNTNNGTAAVKK